MIKLSYKSMPMTIRPRKYGFIDYIKIPYSIQPFYAFLLILFTIISALVPSIQVLVTASFVDTALDIFTNGSPDRIYMPLLLLILLSAYTYSSGVFVNLIRTRMEMRIGEEFRIAITEKRSRLEYQHIENNDSWELISRVSKDPEIRIYGGYSILLDVVSIILKVASILMVLAAQVWWAALAIIAFSVPLFLVAIKSGKTNYEAFKEANKYNRKAWYLQWVLSGRENVEERALFGYTEGVIDKWYVEYETARKINLRTQAKNFVKMKSSSIITIIVAVLIAGVLLLPLSNGLISIGMFMGLVNACFSLVQMMSWQLSYVTQQLANNNEYLKDLSNFSQLEETEGANDMPAADIDMFKLESIEFKNVSFKYPGTDRYILKDCSFILDKDKHYAFVGENGAGKTTITKLLTGLYPDFEGQISINGQSIKEYSYSQLKAIFSVVYQDFAKYYISLKDNIALGKINGIEESRIKEAIREIDLEEAVDKLEKGIDTPLGKILEGGSDLSGGQWQRVAIARTLVSSAPLYILDEPTAALDPVAESRVYDLFGKISRGRMTVFITHRLGAAKLADEILVLVDGKITELGSHDQLMTQQGLYAEMFEAQRSWYN